MDIKDFKGHIFDLDGTLTRSNHVWSKIDEEFLGKRGIKVPEDYFKQVSAMNFEQAAVYTNDRFSLGENIQDIMKEWFDMAVYEYTNVIELCGNASLYFKPQFFSRQLINIRKALSPLHLLCRHEAIKLIQNAVSLYHTHLAVAKVLSKL